MLSRMPQRRTVANPLRRRRGPVPRQGIHAPGVFAAHPAEVSPGLVAISQPKAGGRQSAARLVKFPALQPDLRLIRQAEVLHEVLDAVPANGKTELRPAL